MTEALATLMADKNWNYIWPCYALAVTMFVVLGARAVLRLQAWAQRAKDAENA